MDRRFIVISVGFACSAVLSACGPEGEDALGFSVTSRGLVTKQGEVLVVDGEVDINVAREGALLGTDDEVRQALVGQVALALAEDPELRDSFDAILVFTSFDDPGNSGNSLTRTLFNEVEGIGLPTAESDPDDVFQDQRELYGLEPETNPNLYRRIRQVAYFSEPAEFLEGDQTLDDLNEVGSDFHALVARRLSDRWLMNARIELNPGEPPSARLQREEPDPEDWNIGGGAWSALADADGSVQRGNDWADNFDGTFELVGKNQGFSELDLYLMGFIGPDRVNDFFYLTGARANNTPIESDDDLEVGTIAQAEREDVSIAQIISGMGPRVPAAFEFVPYQRVALVLLTFPGEASEDYQEELEFLQALQVQFPRSWKEWTGVSLCTKLSEACPEPSLVVDEFRISDDNDNLIAPGETVQLTLDLRNVGLGTARGARVRFVSNDPATLSISPPTLSVPDVEQDEEVTLSQPADLTVTSSACGETIQVRTVIELAEGPQTGQVLNIPIGTELVRFDPLDEAPDWKVDPDGTDSADEGLWELGVPEPILGPNGVFVQPPGDHTIGDSELAFFTRPRFEGTPASSDLDGGVTTLQSPVFAIGDTRDPLVRIWVWRSAWNFVEKPPFKLDTPLVIEVSNDGGQTFPYRLEYRGETPELGGWVPVDIRLRDDDVNVLPTNRMVFRFSIEDDTNRGVGNVEAGIDDLEIIDFLDGCPGIRPPLDPPDTDGGGGGDDGGGCRSVDPEFSGVLALLLGLAFVLRRRRNAA